jgi:hypothetical protein
MIDTDRLAPMVRSCGTLGRLVRHGLLGEPEAMAALIAAAEQAQVRGHRSGWRTALAWSLRDAIARAERNAGKAVWRVREAIAPLVFSRAPSAEILRAALAASGSDLMPDEVEQIVERELLRAMRQAPRRRRRAA